MCMYCDVSVHALCIVVSLSCLRYMFQLVVLLLFGCVWYHQWAREVQECYLFIFFINILINNIVYYSVFYVILVSMQVIGLIYTLVGLPNLWWNCLFRIFFCSWIGRCVENRTGTSMIYTHLI